MHTTESSHPLGVTAERSAELDEIVDRAQQAAVEFRQLDQEAVDAVVWAMVVAGLEAATELAELAVQETGFGVFEDKVVKNYVATEFLYDYLKDKRTVGVIDVDLERDLEYVAEPIGVVMAITPITNPTSTVLFKAIVAAKTRNAIVFRPSPRAVRCAERVVEILREAGERAGLPPGALQVIPDSCPRGHALPVPPLRDRLHLDDRRLQGRAGGQFGRQARDQRRTGQCARLPAPDGGRPHGRGRHPHLEDVRRVGHLSRGADVRDRRRHLRRRRRRVPAHGSTSARRRRGGTTRGFRVRLRRRGQSRGARPAGCRACAPSGDRGRGRGEGAARAAAERPRAPCRAPARAREAHADPRAGARARRATRDRYLRARHGARRPRAHLRRLRPRHSGDRPVRSHRAHGPHPRQRPDRGRRPRRRLQLDDPHVLPRLRHVGRIEHHRQRQLPQPPQRQDRLATAHAAAVVPRAVGHLLQRRRHREPPTGRGAAGRDRDRRRHGGPWSRRRGPQTPEHVQRPRLLRRGTRTRRRSRTRRRRGTRAHASRPRRRGRRRLGARRGEGDASLLSSTRSSHCAS